jgi:hypothetical protein
MHGLVRFQSFYTNIKSKEEVDGWMNDIQICMNKQTQRQHVANSSIYLISQESVAKLFNTYMTIPRPLNNKGTLQEGEEDAPAPPPNEH